MAGSFLYLWTIEIEELYGIINRNINNLVHAGAHVIKNNPLTDTHTTGHASQNELRMMLSFMKPKYFVPVHGEYFMLRKHVKIAQECNYEYRFHESKLPKFPLEEGQDPYGRCRQGNSRA